MGFEKNGHSQFLSGILPWASAKSGTDSSGKNSPFAEILFHIWNHSLATPAVILCHAQHQVREGLGVILTLTCGSHSLTEPEYIGSQDREFPNGNGNEWEKKENYSVSTFMPAF